jgi:hypothetical protein
MEGNRTAVEVVHRNLLLRRGRPEGTLTLTEAPTVRVAVL